MVADRKLLIRKAKEAALEINSEIEDGRPVLWEQIAFMPTPDGTQISLSDQPFMDQGEQGNASQDSE